MVGKGNRTLVQYFQYKTLPGFLSAIAVQRRAFSFLSQYIPSFILVVKLGTTRKKKKNYIAAQHNTGNCIFLASNSTPSEWRFGGCYYFKNQDQGQVILGYRITVWLRLQDRVRFSEKIDTRMVFLNRTVSCLSVYFFPTTLP